MRPTLMTLLCLLSCSALLTACATPSTPPRVEVRYVTVETPTELKTCPPATRPPEMQTERQLAAWMTPEVINGWACRLGVERLDDLD